MSDNTNRVITCPECENEIQLEEGREYKVGDIIECPYCGFELEVVNVKDGELEVEVIEEEK
jgi:lysine biosynthesis protein LysW